MQKKKKNTDPDAQTTQLRRNFYQALNGAKTTLIIPNKNSNLKLFAKFSCAYSQTDLSIKTVPFKKEFLVQLK